MKRLKGLIRELISQHLQQREDESKIIWNPYVAGKLFPLDTGPYHLLARPKRPDEESHSDFPVPPRELWEGYGVTESEYLESGRRHMRALIEVLSTASITPDSCHRVLDFGCAAGRLIRFFPLTGGKSEVWGVDVNAKYIGWCQANISPPFLFATTTTLPHLPFEDGYFDLVYCCSVFTHITDLSDMWLLEVRRVLRKGGHAYITIQDKTSMEVLLAKASAIEPVPQTERSWEKIDGEPGTSSALLYLIGEFDRQLNLKTQDYAAFSFLSDPYSNVFYDTQFIVEKWSRFLDIVSVTPMAYGCQTALLCRK